MCRDMKPLTLFTDVGFPSPKGYRPKLPLLKDNTNTQSSLVQEILRHGHVYKTCLASIANRQAIIPRLFIIKTILQCRQHKTPTFSGGPDMSFTNMRLSSYARDARGPAY